jgi:hypothetical protein
MISDEIGYFILRGVPGFADEDQANVEEALFRAWDVMASMYCADQSTSSHEWEHPMVGLLGLAIATIASEGADRLRDHVLRCVRRFRDLVQEDEERDGRVADHIWDYLQLLGAWTTAFLATPDLGEEILNAVSRGRPFSFGLGGIASGGRTRYGILGYPEIFYHDFGLPNPRNV